MWSWTLYFLHHFLNCYAFWKCKNYSLQWNYTVVSSSEKDYRISSYRDITCLPIMLFIQNVWRLFKPNYIISQEIGNSHFVIYWGNSVSFSLSQPNILNEWQAESQADCLIGTGELLEGHGAGGDGEEEEDDGEWDGYAADRAGWKHTVSDLCEGIQQRRSRTSQLTHQD